MDGTRKTPWESIVAPPVVHRAQKPRQLGFTMVIDKGLGLGATHDLLDTGAPYIDFIKFAFGSSLLYSPSLLAEKVAMIRKRGIDVYPGGTLMEIAMMHAQEDAFIDRALELGFTYVEVSEGTVSLSPVVRRRMIERAHRAGLGVITEVGKKDRSYQLSADAVARQVADDLECGARFVIIEGRDSGVGIGVYDEAGKPREEMVDEILASVSAPDRLMWEAPLTSQQQYWIRRLGPDVNLGNVQTDDVLTLESTRLALRGDTLRAYAQASFERA